jgi:hypothetical protein
MKQILKETVMVFLAQVAARHLGEMIQTLAEGSLDSENPCGYVVQIVGAIKCVHRVCIFNLIKMFVLKYS